jgi:DnaJ-class molecular chaperone
MSEDFYRDLGVERSASEKEIQSAYRKMARKYHPDMNPDDAKAKSQFQKVQRAYEVLSDSKKRALYDQFGSSFESVGSAQPGESPYGGRGGAGPFPNAGGATFDFSDLFEGRPGNAGDAGSFADIFRQFTRGNRRTNARTSPKGNDLHHEIEVPFQTAFRGGEAQISLVRGNAPAETITVKIPAGIEDRKKIRIRGQGQPTAGGGVPGDILLTVRVAPHPYFHRKGNNLEVKLPITLQEAVEGAKVDLPTPDGIISLTIPPKSSSGRRLRVRGLGFPLRDGSRGDLFAEVQIVLPDLIAPPLAQAIRTHAGNAKNPRAGLVF